MFKKPLFWIILLIVITIICFILFGHRRTTITNSISASQTTPLLLPDQKLPSAPGQNHPYLMEKNLTKKAANTPEKETEILNLPNVPTQTYIPPQNQTQNAPQSANPNEEDNTAPPASTTMTPNNPSNTNALPSVNAPIPSNPPS